MERIKRERAGDDGKRKERKRGSRLFSLPIVPRAPTIFFYDCSFFFVGGIGGGGGGGGVPSGILCGGEKLTIYRLYVFTLYIFSD